MNVYFKLILLILTVSCNILPEKKEVKTSEDTTDKISHSSMKGFDLYAWKKDGGMLFTLLPGTNRNKTTAEIYDLENAVEDMSAIELKINEIDSGEYIYLTAIDMDTNDLKPLITYMKSKNLNVAIIR